MHMEKVLDTLAAVLRAGLTLAEGPRRAIRIQVTLERVNGLARASARTHTAYTEVQP
jgi:hypothetical protein